jgi:hypothetical protein
MCIIVVWRVLSFERQVVVGSVSEWGGCSALGMGTETGSEILVQKIHGFYKNEGDIASGPRIFLESLRAYYQP